MSSLGGSQVLAYIMQDGKNIISKMIVEKNKVSIEVEEGFKKEYLKDNFFVTYNEPEMDLTLFNQSIVTIPFILNIISIIWISGEDYYIDTMDEDLHYSLIRIKKVLSRMYPDTSWNGRLIPRALVKNISQEHLKDREKELALFFSGGLDSTTSALSNLDKKLLLITVRGQWDVPLGNAVLWEEREKDIRAFAEKYGFTNAFIESNFFEFLNWDRLESLSEEITSWRLDTCEGMGIFGLAMPLLFSKGYSLARIAASYTWEYPWPSSANPVIDNSLRIASHFRLEHDQFEYSRADKIEFLLNLVADGVIDSAPKLKACDSKNAANCLHQNCSKCIPTAFMLFALGADPSLYGFNISQNQIIEEAQHYLKNKQLYWTLWELRSLKDKLLQKESIGVNLDWFMELDFKKLIKNEYIKEKNLLYWQNYKDLVPKTFNIPTVMSKQL